MSLARLALVMVASSLVSVAACSGASPTAPAADGVGGDGGDGGDGGQSDSSIVVGSSDDQPTPQPPSTETVLPFQPLALPGAPALRPSGATDCPAQQPIGIRPIAGHLLTAEPEPPPSVDDPAGTTTTTIPTPASAIANLRTDKRVAGDQVSASVWIDGVGEAITNEPDLALKPASNQKLLTAMAVLAHIDPNERLRTRVLATGPTTATGTILGDLVLVGGGDPSLEPTGPHSIDALATAVAAAGIRRVDGRVVVDESRYDQVRTAPGWPAQWWEDVGSLSALAVDRNWYRLDDAFRNNPGQYNADLFAFALKAHGVEIRDGGAVEPMPVSGGVEVAGTESATVNELVNLMLLRSDNFFAESLLKELGYRSTGGQGTTAGGIEVMHRLFAGACAPIRGTDADGSGLSYDNARSARELRTLVQVGQRYPWGSLLVADLPLAGASDAFGNRLKDPATTGRVRAKGGSLNVSRSLTGFTATATGRAVVFSVIINGPNVREAQGAIDDFIIAIASLRL